MIFWAALRDLRIPSNFTIDVAWKSKSSLFEISDTIFDTITPKITDEISNKDDFDFHAIAIVKLLGMRKSLNAAQNIMSAEIKRILNYSSAR